MLEIKRINKYFGDNHVLKNVDLQIQSNKTTVIIGSSGSGKSTLLRCINLLEIPDSGVIKWENEILDFETKIPKSVCQNFTKKTGMVLICTLFTGQSVRRVFLCVIVMSLK